MAKLAEEKYEGGGGSGGKRHINKRYELTTTQLLVGAVVFYLMF